MNGKSACKGFIPLHPLCICRTVRWHVEIPMHIYRHARLLCLRFGGTSKVYLKRNGLVHIHLRGEGQGITSLRSPAVRHKHDVHAKRKRVVSTTHPLMEKASREKKNGLL